MLNEQLYGNRLRDQTSGVVSSLDCSVDIIFDEIRMCTGSVVLFLLLFVYIEVGGAVIPA